jgi:membrane protease YdiL (CAAX protease family)
MSSAASPDTANGGKRRRFDSPVTDWPWWLAPLGLVLALILSVFASLIVNIPLAVLGVHVSGSKPPGAVLVIETVIQDLVFVGTAVVLAGIGARKVASWQFGLRPTPLRRAAGLILLAMVAFLVFIAFWSQFVHSEKDQVLEKLGAKEGAALLVASAALTCVVAPICEELLFRGFIFTALRNLRGPWLATLLTGLLFGAVHSASAPAEDLLPLAALGSLLCLLYRATGSIYPCIVVHAVNNAVAFGEIEKWGWPTLVLLFASLGCIALVILAARRVGLIADTGAEMISVSRPSPGSV